MKSDFGTVSNIRQHNVFYMYSKKALFIPEDIENLNGGFRHLAAIQKSIQHELQEDQRAKKKEEREAQYWEQQQRYQQEQQRHQKEEEEKKNRDDDLALRLTLFAIFISVIQSGPVAVDVIANLRRGVNAIDIIKLAIFGLAFFVLLVFYFWQTFLGQK